MDSLLMPVALELRERFDFAPYRCVLDVGGAWGTLPLLLLERYPELRAIVFDLPPVGPIAREHIAAAGAASRIRVQTGDMFADPLPSGADLIVLGWILHDWDNERCERLLRRCFEALPSGGHVLLLEMVLDEDRSGPPLPALMSLNMLVATLNGRERTGSEFCALLTRAGFVEPHVEHLHGPRDYVLARKP
jgi:cyclopropane fatty-acyl-phospholipid synthase-like methyltransferase